MAIEHGDSLIRSVEEIIGNEKNTEEKLLSICQLLEREVPHYHWVGFYLTDPDEERMLVLGPYVGDPTDHTRIPFGSGICGQAADTGKLFLIQDVSQEDNYLSCSPSVRSEIVLPIMTEDRILGELDIDSHDLSPFTEDDNIILSEICEMVSKII